MNVWIFELAGFYVGGLGVVIAETEAEARKLLFQSPPASCLHPSRPDLLTQWAEWIAKATVTSKPVVQGVVYTADGDY